MSGLTIYCEDPEMENVYTRYGFEKTENEQYMVLELNDNKDKK